MNSADSKDIIDKINSGDYKCMKNDAESLLYNAATQVWQHYKEIFDIKTNIKLEFVQ